MSEISIAYPDKEQLSKDFLDFLAENYPGKTEFADSEKKELFRLFFNAEFEKSVSFKRTFSDNDETSKKNREYKGKRLRKFVNDYVLFDFETTGKYINSCEIIEIAAVKVKNNEIIESFQTLIKPSMEIPNEITAITGITDEMVLNAPALTDVLPDFLKFIENEILIGHNINAFDLNLLYDKSLELLDVTIENNFVDTYDLAHCYFSELEIANYKLTTLCNHFGCVNENAHRALSDAIANHMLYQKMKEYPICGYCQKETSSKKSTALQPFECLFEITGKKICLTGNFEIGNRELLKKELSQLGAKCVTAVSGKTDFLIIGNLGSDSWKNGTSGTKEADALSFNAKGSTIQILRENEFLKY